MQSLLGRWKALPPQVRFAALFSLLHLGLLACFTQFHELWRDEVRALNIVLDSGSLGALLQNLHNEGHPALWYLVLYLGYAVFHTKAVLVAASVLIAEAAVFVLVAYAPFPRWQRVLFAFGLFPLYEYSVVCRNYGLAMLFIFVFCALYPKRFERPILFGVVLALLANSTAYCALLAAWMLFLWLGERAYQIKRGCAVGAAPRQVALGAAVAVFGIAASIYVFRADETSLFYHPQNLTVTRVFHAYVHHLKYPAWRLAELFSVGPKVLPLPFVLAIVFWSLTAYLLVRNPTVGLLLYGSIAGFDIFSRLVYAPSTRHKGIAFLMIVAALWLDRQLPERELAPRLALWIRRCTPVVAGFVPVLLAVQVVQGARALYRDYTLKLSGNADLAKVIEQHPELRDATVIGEPDLRIEALSYYIDNPIYQARDRRYARKVNFSDGSASDLSLDGLLSLSRKLKRETKKPVILVIGPKLVPEGPFESEHMFVKTFHYDLPSLARFRGNTNMLASIRDEIAQIVDPEEFDAYVLK